MWNEDFKKQASCNNPVISQFIWKSLLIKSDLPQTFIADFFIQYNLITICYNHHGFLWLHIKSIADINILKCGLLRNDYFLIASLCFDYLFIESKGNAVSKIKFLCDKKLTITSIIGFHYTFVQIAFWKILSPLGNSVFSLTGLCNPSNLLWLWLIQRKVLKE